MNETPCSCPAGRPLGAEHTEPCALAGTARVVQIFRNPETGRPIAVPDEIVTEAEREYRAYKLHVQGLTWREIADREHYPNGGAASEAVKRYLDEGRAVVGSFRRPEVMAVEIAVLRAMRAALWDDATLLRKPAAVMAILGTVDRMVKLFGLDTADEADVTVQTVVVPSEDYIEQLRLAAAQGEPLDQADAG